jgi:hypothetical protein
MVYVSVFKDLIEKYPTWSELAVFLTSKEGGSLHISDKNETFCIIRTKHVARDLPHVKWFRSTVWNMALNRPVSVAPPKASKIFPYQTCQKAVEAGLFCQEFYDGFMINCFTHDGKLMVTSRSKLNATGHFYSSKSFYELFQESYKGDLNKCVLDSVSYSFLVQHQEHRVVTPITENHTYVVHKVSFLKDGSFHVEDHLEEFQGRVNIPSIIMDPTMQVDQWVNHFMSNKSWEFQGVVLKDLNGNRWRFRNPSYMHVKELRGNCASHIERFAQLYVQNRIKIYLEYYPLESFTFLCNNVFMNMIHQTVYNYYVQVHITKKSSMNDIERVYRRHVYQLHKYYVNVLRCQRRKITFNEVSMYFFNLPWHNIAYLVHNMQDSYFKQVDEVVSDSVGDSNDSVSDSVHGVKEI